MSYGNQADVRANIPFVDAYGKRHNVAPVSTGWLRGLGIFGLTGATNTIVDIGLLGAGLFGAYKLYKWAVK